MKVWLFYRLPHSGFTSELYAYSDKKKYAKKFQEERDMSLFKVETVDLNSKEFCQIMLKYPRGVLMENAYETKTFILGVARVETVIVIGPESEILKVFHLTERVEHDLAEHTNVMTKYLKSEYLKSLEIFKYFDMIRFNPDLFYDPFFESRTTLEFHQFALSTSNTFRADALGIFLNPFGWSMKFKHD